MISKIHRKTAAVLAALNILLLPFAGCAQEKATTTGTLSKMPSSSVSVPDQLAASQISSAEATSSVVSSEVSKPFICPPYPEQPPRNAKRPNIAYLTFDDGPTELTPQILDILKEYDVKATFFVVHKNSPKLAAYVKRAYDEGHEIAVHSYTHNYRQIYRSLDAYMEDFEKTSAWIKSITGQDTTQFRFPGGSSNAFVSKENLNRILYRMGELHYVHHDWNVSSGDAVAKPPSKEKIACTVVRQSLRYNEPVILMHDASKNKSTRDALPAIIEGLREKGYLFDTISNIHKPSQHRVYSQTGSPIQGPNSDKHTPNVSRPSSSAPEPPVSSAVQSGGSSAASSEAVSSKEEPSISSREESSFQGSSNVSSEESAPSEPSEPTMPPTSSEDTCTRPPEMPNPTE